MTPHRRPCPSSQRPTARTIKRTTEVSPLAPRCWHLLNPGGLADFSGSSSSSAINSGTGSVSRDKGVEEKKASDISFGAPVVTTPAVIAFSGAAMDESGFYFGAAPSSSVISLPNKGSEAKDTASDNAFLFGAASLPSAATPPPRRFSPRHWPRPSHSEPECPYHASEVSDHPGCISRIFYRHIENGGGQRYPLIIYGKNKKVWERIADESSDPKE